ncbi:class I adenylate-forming enzyme family protein [Paraburkholderia solisilvae]|uniref:Long-chain-fatty-acid--CoA ligase n=1 Tax=Paraburkholderia solisilvae TaxID=624376 RepID=A0A6J5DPP7_9BURK|nr:class I adenylate-forming enzyme family protein [Paraburkholderia solisilvae]CAB3756219.1 Long-chain-fatty-acid--CoA ligase [Paraburkholderia solisilvae]
MSDPLIVDEILQPSETPLKALYRHAYEQPDATALIAGDDVWTYGRLANDVARLSGGLKRAEVLPGDRIVLVVRTAPLYAVFMYAAMITGAIVVPLKTEFKAIELNELLRMQRPAVFVYEADLQDVVSEIDPELLRDTQSFLADDIGMRSWRCLLDDESAKDVALPVDIDSVFLLLATSGTTGKPKLVAYNQRVMSYVVGARASWNITRDTCMVGNTPVAHASGTIGMLAALIAGCREVLLKRFDADAVLDVIEAHGATMVFLTPFLCLLLIEAQRNRPRDVRSLRLCVVAGDACRPQVATAFESTFGIQLRNIFGMTECSGSTTFGYDHRLIRGVPGRTRLVGTDGLPVAPGEVGEMQLRGPNLSLGYWTGPGVVVNNTQDGWFSSGDLMEESVDGDYRFVGRRKDLIVHNASNISPVEVETELIQHEAVEDAAVAGAPDDVSGQRVVALVKLTSAATSDISAAGKVLEWIKSRIAAFKVPERIVIVDVIPRNALGKVDRNEVTRIVMCHSD